MELKFGIYPNCSEWDEQVGGIYYDEAAEIDEEYFKQIEKAVLEGTKEKEWD